MVKAMGPAEVPSDLRRGVPGAKHTHSIGHMSYRQKERAKVTTYTF